MQKQHEDVPKVVWVDATWDKLEGSWYGFISLCRAKEFRKGSFKSINEAEMEAAKLANELLGPEVEIKTDSEYVITHWELENPITKVKRNKNPADTFLRNNKEIKGKK